MPDSFQLCIVIPCYNEEKRLNIARYSNFLNLHKHVLVCFVNDGSNDNTLQVLTKIKSNLSIAMQLMILKKLHI